LGLLTVGSSQVQTQKWKDLKLATITFGTECCFFCGKMLGKNPVFFDWAMLFFVSLTVTVGFGPVDGWFLTGPNSKLERVSASWQQITFGTECWIFFVARGWERVQSFDWAMHFCLVRLTVGPYR